MLKPCEVIEKSLNTQYSVKCPMLDSAITSTIKSGLSERYPTRTDDPKVKALENVDWAFSARSRGDAIDSLHPYPAKFISQIPGTILDVLEPEQGSLVLDPFCGSGTTLLAAQRRGFNSIGVDLNPIACLISRVKTSPTPFHLDIDAEEVIAEARSDMSPYIPDIPNLNHWFKPDIQVAVGALVGAIGRRSNSSAFDALRLALSSILVRVSNQESDTRYAAIDKNIEREDVFTAFSAACLKLLKTLNARDWKLCNASVVEGDILSLSPSEICGRVGVVITSPPYPNAYEYWLYHKYRMWWLGFDPLAVKASEIGARAHFFKRDRHTAGHFSEQMRGTLSLIDSVLLPGGWVCFVVGRSKIHGTIVDNADTIREVSCEMGFSFETRIERVIAANRKSFNLAHANIKTESIVVLRKP